MVTIVGHQIIKVILLYFIGLFTFFPTFAESLTIISPPDGSTYAFGKAVPVNVMNSNGDTAISYTATFICAAGTYQVAGLTLGLTYMIVPAGLHGLTNLIVTAAAGTTAVTTINIDEPVCPTPPPLPIYAPSERNPYILPPLEAPQCPRPCSPIPNTQCVLPNRRTIRAFNSPFENTNRRSSIIRRTCNRSSRLSSTKQKGQLSRKHCQSPLVTKGSCRIE